MFRVVVGRRGRVGPLFTIAVKLADAMGRYDVGAAVLVLSKVDLVLLLSEKSVYRPQERISKNVKLIPGRDNAQETEGLLVVTKHTWFKLENKVSVGHTNGLVPKTEINAPLGMEVGTIDNGTVCCIVHGVWEEPFDVFEYMVWHVSESGACIGEKAFFEAVFGHRHGQARPGLGDADVGEVDPVPVVTILFLVELACHLNAVEGPSEFGHVDTAKDNLA